MIYFSVLLSSWLAAAYQIVPLSADMPLSSLAAGMQWVFEPPKLESPIYFFGTFSTSVAIQVAKS